MEDLLVPAFYVVKKGLGVAQTEFLLHALRITPIIAVIITDAYDAEVAMKMSNEILRTPPFENARELPRKIFQDFDKPTLVIGESTLFDAYYLDGHVQPMELGDSDAT